MAHPYNLCANCEYCCDEGEPCIYDHVRDEDRAYDKDQARRICEEP